MQIKGATALITGGASGLGAATAERLWGMGANVVLLDVNAEKGQALAAKLGERAAFVQTDVMFTEQNQEAIRAAKRLFGKIDILANIAGIGTYQPTASKDGPHSLEEFKRVLGVSLIGSFDTARLAAFEMISNEPNEEGERGVIINTSSNAAQDGQSGLVAYASAKAGIIGMTLVIARDLGNYGIRCCAIAPGPFDTPLVANVPEALKEAVAKQSPFPQRWGRPSEFAMLVQQILENPLMNGETYRLHATRQRLGV
ncbi:MAG: SDR family NAD(P)-dependent oxidoreductase [Dehalococcoidia bacterium]|nr:SDR family NAD(P)-dependent oxidoreductase [Dehalococcoidia bacterium]